MKLRIYIVLPVMLTIFVVCSFFSFMKAQDPVLSQFYAAPMFLNPAFAGTTDAPRVGLNYRNQWSSIFNAYTTYAVSYDQYFEAVKSGFGVAAMVDNAGDGTYQTGHFNLTYSYRFPVTDGLFVKGGIQAGIYQTTLNWDKLVFLDQINPLNGETSTLTEEQRPEQLSHGSFDISSGLLVYSEIFYGGFAIYHISSPDDNFLNSDGKLQDGLPIRISLHGGAQISLNSGNKTKYNAFISPNVMYTQQGDFKQVNAGVYAGWGPIFGGAWFRHTFSNRDAFILSSGINYNIFKIGYSHDVTLSKLSSQSNGSHEISILLNFDVIRDKSVDYNDCLQLFR